MRYIKPYQIFEASATASAALTQEQIKWLDKCAAGRWKLNTSTGLVDVERNFDCSGQGLTDLKGVKFGKVSGGFNCAYNHLTSLVGAPQTVGGINCSNNELTTLEGAPQTVGGYFNCAYNHLTSLVGAPKTVGAINCSNNELTTLEGAPQSVGGDFICGDNELTTLEGAPKTVVGGFWCDDNELTSLEGAPQSVGGNFRCSGNPVSGSTLKDIFALMKSGMGYQQALVNQWYNLEGKDRAVLYKQMPNLTPEDVRKYQALATYANIKGYL